MSYETEFAQSFVQGEDFFPERFLAMAFVLHGSWIQKTNCSPVEFNARLEMHKLYEEVGMTEVGIQYGVHLETGEAEVQNRTRMT
jgi:hypothetical protein